MPAKDIRLLLGRRPRAQEDAFGFVKVSSGGRDRLYETLESAVRKAQSLTEVDFHPDDIAETGEVLVGDLAGMDANFQKDAPWSLERLVTETQSAGQPAWLTENGIAAGRWTFYAIAAKVDGQDAVLIRAQGATYGMDLANKLVTIVKGNELKVVEEPLLGFDGKADAVVIDDRVFVVEPRKVERLFIDADAVKARAPKTAAAFDNAIGASLSTETTTAVQAVCGKNANVARRVERLVRDGTLSKVTTQSIRGSLADANEAPDALGQTGPLVAETDRLAKLLVDLAADLYYQPRYAATPRRIAAYRNLK